MTRRALVLLAPLIGLSAAPVPADVRIGVFGLFHPRSLVVSADTSVLSLRGDHQSCVLREGEEARVDMHAGTLRDVRARCLFQHGCDSRDGRRGTSR